MSDTPEGSRPLHLQTIDSLFAELIGGTSVSVGDQNDQFALKNVDSRSILNWYRLNRNKWAGNVMASDVEAMESAMKSSPAALPMPDPVTPKAGRRLLLAKVVAHRFAGVHAGVHAYGTAELGHSEQQLNHALSGVRRCDSVLEDS